MPPEWSQLSETLHQRHITYEGFFLLSKLLTHTLHVPQNNQTLISLILKRMDNLLPLPSRISALSSQQDVFIYRMMEAFIIEPQEMHSIWKQLYNKGITPEMEYRIPPLLLVNPIHSTTVTPQQYQDGNPHTLNQCAETIMPPSTFSLWENMWLQQHLYCKHHKVPQSNKKKRL